MIIGGLSLICLLITIIVTTTIFGKTTTPRQISDNLRELEKDFQNRTTGRPTHISRGQKVHFAFILTDGSCATWEQCVSTEKCPEYLIKREELNNLPQLGPQYKRLLAELKSQVCNKAERKICCPQPAGECGLSKLTSGFVRFDRNVTKY